MGVQEKKRRKNQFLFIVFIHALFTGSWDTPSFSFKALFYVPLLCYQSDKLWPQAKQLKGEGGTH